MAYYFMYNKNNAMDKVKYLYRRQFILGPYFKENLINWKREKINNTYFCTIHPDLQFSKLSWNNNFLIVLGYMLDPYNPTYNENMILNSMAEGIKNYNDLFAQFSKMCGRFVIIAKINDNFRIFNDAAGMRQIFYCKDDSNNLWCASQPSIIADQLNLHIDPKIKNDLFKLTFFAKTTEYWYPGNSTIYKNIHHLTPNHFINLQTGDVVRFWPLSKIRKISFNECLNRSTFLLENMLLAATNRFNIALGLSAGYDCRIVLAASKKVCDKIFYYTLVREGPDFKCYDASIPAKLLPKLNLIHHTIKVPSTMDKEFESLLNSNITTARESKGLNTYGTFKYFANIEKQYILASGNISEIAKRNVCRLPRLPNALINGHLLSLLSNMQGSNFVVKKYNEWLASVQNLPRLGFNLLDMFYWEQRMANWAAMTFSEMDIAFENFSPFNCRELLENMICLPLKYRSQPDYLFHTELIRAMWPETLLLPINPKNDIFQKKINYFLFKFRIYDILKYLYVISIRSLKK